MVRSPSVTLSSRDALMFDMIMWWAAEFWPCLYVRQLFTLTFLLLETHQLTANIAVPSCEIQIGLSTQVLRYMLFFKPTPVILELSSFSYVQNEDCSQHCQHCMA